MKKLCFIFLFCSLINSVSKAQSWSPLGVGINGTVYSLCVFNNELFAGGQFTTTGNVFANNIANWNGTAWNTADSLSSIISNNSLCVYNGSLYAGAGALMNWNGVMWDTIITRDTIDGYPYNSYCLGGTMCVYNGLLYGGGYYFIEAWNGSQCDDSVGQGFSNSANINALCAYNGELYAGGRFTQAGSSPASNIAKWNGTSWASPSIGVNGSVTCLAVYNNELYAGGNFSLAGGITAWGIAKWNGSTWSAVGPDSIFVEGDNEIFSFAVYNGALYAGGYIAVYTNYPDYAYGVIKWDGTSWTPVGAGLGIGVVDSALGSGFVYSLCVYDGALYAGGDFNYSGTTFTNHIAKWTGVTGIQENSFDETALSIYPNPSSGKVSIAFSKPIHDGSLKIFNTLGEVVYQSAINNEKAEIDFTKRSAGIYFIQVGDEQRQYVTKLVIE